MVAANRAQIALNEGKAYQAALNAKLASLEEAKRHRERDFQSAKTAAEHRQAMALYEAFTDRQANLYAKCVTEVNGKVNQLQKDTMIYKIWMSDSSVQTCHQVAAVKMTEETLP